MSAAELPDDLSRWPRNAFELLGVQTSSDKRTVRKAYSNLIRRFKPEHFPEHFRRIRDAYESVQQHIEQAESSDDTAWFQDLVEEAARNQPVQEELDSDSIDVEPDLNAADSEADTDPDAEHEHLLASPKPPRFDPHAVWQTAQAGQPQEAYLQYVEQVEQGRYYEDLYLRLYWLLRLHPQFDETRDACQWLVAGMMNLGLRGRLLELYMQDIADDPHEGVGRRCKTLLGINSAPGRLADLLTARWKAAGKLEVHTIIVDDAAQLRGRFHNDPAVWGRLLLTAIDILVWADEPELQTFLQEARREVEQIAEEVTRLTPELDRRDTLMELVASTELLRQVMTVPAPWRHALRLLIRNSWNEPLEAIRPRLMAVLAPLVQNPIRGIEWLDALETRCRPALHYLGQLAAALARQTGADRMNVPGPTLHQRFLDYSVLLYFGKGKLPSRWQKLVREPRDRTGRVELLVFCLQERITAKHLMHVLAASPRADFVELLRPAQSAVLHYICLANLAFWA
jgi:hypothetical protein